MKFRRLRGFTLVELMVAMAILGMVLVLGYSGLHLGMRHWHAAQRQGQAMQEQRRLHDFFRVQLGHAARLEPADDSKRFPSFLGDSTEIQFLAPLEAAPDGGGLYQFRIKSEPSQGNAGQARLVLEYRHLDPDQPQLQFRASTGAIKQLVVTDALQSVNFSFYGATSLGRQPRWHRQWREVDKVPELVKLQLTGIDGVRWADYVIPLRSGWAR